MRALETAREQFQAFITNALSLQLLHSRQHIIAAWAGAAMPLARVMQLFCQIEPSGILPVAAIDHVAKRAHALLRIVVEPDGADGFAIDQSDLLAPAQIGDRVVAPFGGDTVGNTAAVAAAVLPT